MDQQQKSNCFENLSTKRVYSLIGGAVLLSILYVTCFIVEGITPQISFTVYNFAIALAALLIAWKWNLIQNQKAILWLIPFLFISVCNGIFDENIFTYGNFVIGNLIFAAFCLSLTGSTDIFKLQSLYKIFALFFGHWYSFVYLLKKTNLQRNDGKHKAKVVIKVVTGIIIALPFLTVIAALLLSADAVFEAVVGKFADYLLQMDARIVRYIVFGLIAFIYITGYAYNTLKQKIIEETPYKPLITDNIISNTFLFCINLLFLVFVFIQIAFLFNGGFMRLPDGIIYSQYAREGFFQLLFVTCINFTVIIFFTMIADINEQRITRLMLVILCVFTFALVVSSFYRMNLYIQAYGHTTLRAYVLTFLTMEVLLLISTLFYLLKGKINLYKHYLLIGVIFYGIVNVTGSDYFVTKLNISRFVNNTNTSIDVLSIGRDGYVVLNNFYHNANEFKTGEYTVLGNAIVHGDGSNIIQSENLIHTQRDSYNTRWQSWSLIKAK